MSGIRNRIVKSLKWRMLPRKGLYIFDTGDLKIAADWDGLLAQSLYISGVYHPETVAWMKDNISLDDICVDVGANVGYLTCIMARLGLLVYAFEPHPRMRQLLKYNLRLNGITNVVVSPQAVAEKEGRVRFFENREPMYSGLVGHDGLTHIRWVNTVRLDRVVPHATFVKIDVEGAEHRVLKGMTDLLKRDGLKMIVEVEPDRTGFSEDVYDLLQGWQIRNLDRLNLLCWKDVIECTKNYY